MLALHCLLAGLLAIELNRIMHTFQIIFPAEFGHRCSGFDFSLFAALQLEWVHHKRGNVAPKHTRTYIHLISYLFDR